MSGPYGRIYKGLRTHPKWCGGAHGDKQLQRLSWMAKGLWAELTSMVVGRDGRFCAPDLDNLHGYKQTWLEELVANGLVDRDGDWYRMHDFEAHALTPAKWAEKRAQAAERQARKRASAPQVECDVTHGASVSHGEVTRDITREFLSLSLNSQKGETEGETPCDTGPPNHTHGNAGLARPVPASELLGGGPTLRSRVVQALSQAAIAEAQRRREGAPAEAHPMWDGWRRVADYVLGTARERQWSDEVTVEAAASLVRAFYASDDARTKAAAYDLSYLAKRPAQYAQEARERAA